MSEGFFYNRAYTPSQCAHEWELIEGNTWRCTKCPALGRSRPVTMEERNGLHPLGTVVIEAIGER